MRCVEVGVGGWVGECGVLPAVQHAARVMKLASGGAVDVVSNSVFITTGCCLVVTGACPDAPSNHRYPVSHLVTH